jgi:hypothetical protein
MDALSSKKKRLLNNARQSLTSALNMLNDLEKEPNAEDLMVYASAARQAQQAFGDLERLVGMVDVDITKELMRR